jgi:DNA-directed RNA polymerase specialized sigma24 family protein
MHRKLNVQYPNDEHGVSKLLAGQSEINRVVLILVDSGALSANEVSDLLGEDETVIRRNLAHARKKLIETIVY